MRLEPLLQANTIKESRRGMNSTDARYLGYQIAVHARYVGVASVHLASSGEHAQHQRAKAGDGDTSCCTDRMHLRRYALNSGLVSYL